MKKVFIEWCVGYNGVYVCNADDSLNDEATETCEDLPSLTCELLGEDVLDAINEGEIDPEEISISEEKLAKLVSKAQSLLGSDYEVTHVILNTTDS